MSSHELMLQFTDCYRDIAVKQAKPIKKAFKDYLGVHPNMKTSHDDLKARYNKLSETKKESFHNLKQQTFDKINENIEKCFAVVGELHSVFDDSIDGIHFNTLCSIMAGDNSGSIRECESYVTVGNHEYKLYVDADEIDDAMDRVLFEDVLQLKIIEA
jgi:hypothetical protein